jgi:hypothetical protein
MMAFLSFTGVGLQSSQDVAQLCFFIEVTNMADEWPI